MSKEYRLTDEQKAFLCPTSATHRQYEALRAYFVDKLPSKDAAQRFGYTPGSFRVHCHQFRQHTHRQFFLPERSSRQPEAVSPDAKTSRLHDRVIGLRKQN